MERWHYFQNKCYKNEVIRSVAEPSLSFTYFDVLKTVIPHCTLLFKHIYKHSLNLFLNGLVGRWVLIKAKCAKQLWYWICFNILLDSPCHSILLPIWTLSYTTEYSMEKIVWKSISVHNKINCLPTYTHCLQCLQVGKLETCNDKDIGSITGSSMANFNKVNQYLNKF